MKTLLACLALVSSVATECLNVRTLSKANNVRIYPLPRVVTGLTTTSKGDLAMVNDQGQRVDIFSIRGEFIRQLDVIKSNVLFDIARKQDILFLPEYHAQSIHVVHEDNRYIKNMSILLPGDAVYIWGLAVTGDTLWLTCSKGLYKITFDANYTATDTNLLIPTHPWHNARFRITVLPSQILMTDAQANSLYYFHHNGTELRPPTTGLEMPYGIATDSCGCIYLALLEGERIASDSGRSIKAVVNATCGTEAQPSSLIYSNGSLISIYFTNKYANSSLAVIELLHCGIQSSLYPSYGPLRFFFPTPNFDIGEPLFSDESDY